jgi:putative transposase
MKNKAYKYRIYPIAEQKQLLAQTFGCVRVVWNNLLDWRNQEYSLNGNKINYTKSSAHLTELKNQEQFSWLNDVSSVALQQKMLLLVISLLNVLNILILNENLATNHLD